MRRTEHLSRLGSAGHRRRKPLRLHRTCGQGNRRAVQLFNLHHLLGTVWEESDITATLSPCKWSCTMASRNSLVRIATEDLISGIRFTWAGPAVREGNDVHLVLRDGSRVGGVAGQSVAGREHEGNAGALRLGKFLL